MTDRERLAEWSAVFKRIRLPGHPVVLHGREYVELCRIVPLDRLAQLIKAWEEAHRVPVSPEPSFVERIADHCADRFGPLGISWLRRVARKDR